MTKKRSTILVNGKLEVIIPIRLKYDGSKTVLIQSEDCGKPLDVKNLSPLQKALIQGFQFQKKLESGKVRSVSELAKVEHMERAFLFRALSLVNLAPDIVDAILDGQEPKSLTLSNLRSGFPDDWQEQRAFLGME